MIALALILGSLTDYFVIESPSPVETRNAYLYAMGLGIVSLCIMFFNAIRFHLGLLIGIMTRIIFTGAAYSKVMIVMMSIVLLFFSGIVPQSDNYKSTDSGSCCELGV